MKGKRMVADCRMFPSKIGCTLTISGREKEVLDASVDHAVKKHGHKRSPALRRQIKMMLKRE